MPKKDKKSTTDLKNNPDICLSTGDFVLPNGDKYCGEYCAHRAGLIWRQGKGTYTTHDGQTYEGIWADDKLIDNSEVVIKYPNEVTFHGRLLKNRYSGPGIYTMNNGLDLSCEFSGNKPTGEISLIDHKGILWRGEAKENDALLIPENIFYLNLPPDRGKGVPTEDIASTPIADEELSEKVEEEHSENYWRNIIFAKSKLTDNNVKFGDSKWFKQCEKFKSKKREIERKLKENRKLDYKEELWLAKFMEFRNMMEMKRVEKELRKKKSEQAVFDLNRRFRSPEFLNSCPEVKVIYPSVQPSIKDSGETTASDISTESLVDIDKKKKPSPTVKKQRPRKRAVCLANLDKFSRKLDRLPSDENIPSQKIETEKPIELHFTPDRKAKVLIPRIEVLLTNDNFKDDEERKMLLDLKNTITETASQTEPPTSTVKIQPDDETNYVPTEPTETLLVDQEPLTEQQKRIRRYIKERLAQWEAEDADDAGYNGKIEKDKKKLHLHSFALHTASIDDIPVEIFVDMYGKQRK